MARRLAHAPLSATLALPLALLLALAGCGGSTSPTPSPTPPPTSSPAPTPPPSPTPTPTPGQTTLSGARCATQEVTPTVRVADLVIPDTVKLNLAAPAGFPNGRRLQDPVIDITLNVIFLDLTRHSAGTLASVPVNPAGNDKAFRNTFPYLAEAHGGQRQGVAQQGAYNFRSDQAEAYTRVDRMGMPAVATALIGSSQKNAYNDDSPAQDLTGKWAPEIVSQMSGLSTALQDDFSRLGLSICAQPG